MKCKFCKCTDERACPEGCVWVVVAVGTKNPVELDVCNRCVPEAVMQRLYRMNRGRSCDSLKANACSRGSVARTLERIGARYYLIRRCPLHGDARERIELG